MCVGAQRRTRARVTDEIRATIIEHVINHGLSYREAGDEYSQISAGTQWHPLFGFFEKPTGRI